MHFISTLNFSDQSLSILLIDKDFSIFQIRFDLLTFKHIKTEKVSYIFFWEVYLE